MEVREILSWFCVCEERVDPDCLMAAKKGFNSLLFVDIITAADFVTMDKHGF